MPLQLPLPRILPLLLAALSLSALRPASAAEDAGPGTTRIARWKNDRTAAFLLMFDDGCPSDWQVAIPEMAKRGLIGTFYINADKSEFKKFISVWNDLMPKTGMVYGDHTMTHRGVKDLENARWEIGECARIIRELQPGKPNRLVSFAQPGVGPGKWNLSKDDYQSLMKEYHLVDRPPFAGHGAVYHWKTTGEMVALADKAIAEKGMEYLVIHGVERITPDWGYQDFWALKQTIFLPLLDALKERSDRGDLWITDHITEHQYATERDAATVNVLKVSAGGIQLELKSSTDPALYDQQLTLITRVPPAWSECDISQGTGRTHVAAKDGVITFDALPNGPPVSIRPASGR